MMGDAFFEFASETRNHPHFQFTHIARQPMHPPSEAKFSPDVPDGSSRKQCSTSLQVQLLMQQLLDTVLSAWHRAIVLNSLKKQQRSTRQQSIKLKSLKPNTDRSYLGLGNGLSN